MTDLKQRQYEEYRVGCKDRGQTASNFETWEKQQEEWEKIQQEKQKEIEESNKKYDAKHANDPKVKINDYQKRMFEAELMNEDFDYED